MISRTNIVLAVLLGIVVLLAAVSGVDYSKPNIEVLGGMSMKYSPASTAFESSKVFPNGMTQQDPIPGTIARGEMPLHIAPLPPEIDPKTAPPEDAVPGKELVNPFSLEVLLEQAKAKAQRDEAASKEAARTAAATNNDTANTAGKNTAGKNTAGKNTAGKNTAQKDSSNRKTTVKSSGSDARAESTPTDTDATASDRANGSAAVEVKEPPEAVAQRDFQASVDRGAELFRSFCVCCHGPKGMGDGLVAQRGYPPPPAFQIGTSKLWNDGQLFSILTSGRLNMPPFAAQLPRDSRWDLINYVRSLQQTDSTTVETTTGGQTNDGQTQSAGASAEGQGSADPSATSAEAPQQKDKSE